MPSPKAHMAGVTLLRDGELFLNYSYPVENFNSVPSSPHDVDYRGLLSKVRIKNTLDTISLRNPA